MAEEEKKTSSIYSCDTCAWQVLCRWRNMLSDVTDNFAQAGMDKHDCVEMYAARAKLLAQFCSFYERFKMA